MVVVEWTFAEEEADVKVNRRKKSITLHFIADQGTLIVSLSPSQAAELREKLEEKKVE